MARVHCSLPSPSSVTTELALVALPIAATHASSDLEDDGNGPGWFASSWALRRGLEVREGLPSDANLDEWLTVCLGGETRLLQRVAMRDTASPSSITAIA